MDSDSKNCYPSVLKLATQARFQLSKQVEGNHPSQMTLLLKTWVKLNGLFRTQLIMKLPVQVLRSMNPLLNLRQRILNLHGYQRSARIVNQEGQLQSIRIETNYVPLVITNDLTTLKKVRLQTNTRCSCFPIFPKS